MYELLLCLVIIAASVWGALDYHKDTRQLKDSDNRLIAAINDLKKELLEDE